MAGEEASDLLLEAAEQLEECCANFTIGKFCIASSSQEIQIDISGLASKNNTDARSDYCDN